MAAPGKQSSRWGSFLSQAVAGVEARLDTILADEESAPSTETNASTVTGTPRPASPASSSRTPVSNRPNDRLQERLARAIAAKSAAQKSDTPQNRASSSLQGSPRQSIDGPPRSSSESAGPDLAGQSTEVASPRGSEDVARSSQEVALTAATTAQTSESTNGDEERPAQRGDAVTKQGSVEEKADGPPASAEKVNEEIPTVQDAHPESMPVEPRANELEKALEEARLQHQEETHIYIERIDALESKLQFLAREAADSARKAALEAPAGSIEKKLAEKDQQIAQLIEEGKNLASTEQKHRAILKKLRVKMAEDEKELAAVKAAKEKMDRETEGFRIRARQADELEKTHGDLQKRIDQLQRDVNTLKPELSSKNHVIADLRQQLQEATAQVEAAATKVNEQAREQDQRRIAELEESVAALQVEKNLVSDRAKAQVNDWREKAERASERTKALELEMKAEVQAMESKLEAMRVRAEEASSGAIGDYQAKLLRQVETLQTQYSIANDNWQGIEATLLARISSLGRERDEALQRESEIRKKAREAAVRAKRNEEELEEARAKLPSDTDTKSLHDELEALRTRAEQAEKALAEFQTEFERQKQAWKEETEARMSRPPSRPPVERRGWLDDFHNGAFRSEPFKMDSRPGSPLLSPPQRTLSSDLLGIQSLPNKTRKPSATPSNGDVGITPSGSLSRRASALPGRPTITTGAALSYSASAEALATPTLIHPLDREREDTFEGVEVSSSPQQMLQDMVSVSTVAAGPSVQLVERMSAAIRRLESEKVAAREELSRISKQRDEARAEIVALMRETEAGKAALQRVTELEAEVAEVNSRYETTLEMLGEKSELVEELRADVDDVKAMYRDLVERTVR